MKVITYASAWLILSTSASFTAPPDYLTEVKPLLASRCFDCHGSLKQKAKLRVDTASAMLDAEVVIAGKSEESELIHRIITTDPDERMPPEHEGALFTPAQVDVIRRWIEAGAPAPENEHPEAAPEDHWAFQRIERPILPTSPSKNPIDAILTASQKEIGINPQPEAERTILLRRLYLDLTGLPPTLKQQADTRDVETITDELLASDLYGERWGRHWMDVWRYSDWYGLGKELRNGQKHLWHWRDWIVDSLNKDKGYDRMIQEMLAGDELDPSNPEAVTATGYLARNYYLFNRTTWLDATIEHTGKAFLGLTFNCAKCHDHKYDPISQIDYYNFRAFFEPHHIRLDALPGQTDLSKDGIPRAFDDKLDAKTWLHIRGNPATPNKKREITSQVPALFSEFAKTPQTINLPHQAWAPGSRHRIQEDQRAASKRRLTQAEAALEKAISEKSSSVKTIPQPPPLAAAKGKAFSDNFERGKPNLWEIVGNGWRYQGGSLVQLETVQESQYVRSRIAHPENFELSLTFRTTGGGTWRSVGFRFDVDEATESAHTIYASAHMPRKKVQIAHKNGGRITYPPQGKANQKIELNRDYTLKAQVRNRLLNVSLDGKFLLAYELPARFSGRRVELFAFDVTAEFEEIHIRPLPDTVSLKPATTKASTLADSLDLKKATVAQATAELDSINARIAADRVALGGEPGDLDALTQSAIQLEHKHAIAQAEVKATAEGKPATPPKPKTTYTPIRGSLKAPVKSTEKSGQYPPIYPKTSTGRRLALADWITARDNPLTARVAVNHIWMRHFGEPLVEKVFDFGRQSKKPQHATLLDTLAMELIDSGWRMKHLHRLIVTSDAYKRSASNLGVDPKTLSKDPTNQLYWRTHSPRMDSNLIRDSLLHLAGELDLKRGGPPIQPNPDARRRSLYFRHSRDDQARFLTAFDNADVFACYRRESSIVPQQALALINSKEALQMSAKLAAQISGDDEAFSREAFRRILCREATDEEVNECLAFLKEVPLRARLILSLFNHNDFLMIR